MERHAYLILAHADAEQLQRLVEALDDPRNDIYIHIDAKSDISLFEGISTRRARLDFIAERVDVRWGHTSVMHAEYALFRCVAGGAYSRIHLLSGADFPLRSQDYIHRFFSTRRNEEFIEILDMDPEARWGEISKKMRVYNPFMAQGASRTAWVGRLFVWIRRMSMMVQTVVGVRRRYTFNDLRKGAEWVSVTQEFVDALMSHEMQIKREYRLTNCCDEIYKQTVAWNTHFRQRLSTMGSLRLIDFDRGNGYSPYTWRESDIEELAASDALFVRKVVSGVSGRLPELIRKRVWNKTNL